MKTLLKTIWNFIVNLFATTQIEIEKLQQTEEIHPEMKENDESQYKRTFEILCKRPEKMSFQAYKEHLKKQKEWIKNRKQGFFVYVSTEIFTREFTDKKGNKSKQQYTKTHKPFVGIVRDLRPI